MRPFAEKLFPFVVPLDEFAAQSHLVVKPAAAFINPMSAIARASLCLTIMPLTSSPSISAAAQSSHTVDRCTECNGLRVNAKKAHMQPKRTGCVRQAQTHSISAGSSVSFPSPSTTAIAFCCSWTIRFLASIMPRISSRQCCASSTTASKIRTNSSGERP